MTRLAALVIASLALCAPGCGDGSAGDKLLQEDALRACLADAGLGARTTAGTGGYLLILPAPDFLAQAEDGTDVSVTVYGTEEKAQRAAADARSATQTLGDPVEVVSKRNAMIVFNPPPSDNVRNAAEGCLD